MKYRENYQNGVCRIVLYSFIVCMGLKYVAAQYKDITRLLEDLQTGYRKEVLPKRFSPSYVAVKVHPAIIRIEDLDAEKEELSSTVSLSMNWVDDRLKWDPKLYNGIREIHVPASQLWLPDIAVHNTIYPPISRAENNQLVEVDWLGTVTYVEQVQARSYCHVHFTWFPRDQQTCHIIFSSWIYSVDYILLQFWHESLDGVVDVPVLADSDSNLPNLDGHTWQLSDRKAKAKINLITYSCCPDEAYAQLNITLTITRSSSMLTCMLLLPMLVVSALVPLQFCLAYTSSQRHLYGLLLVFGEMLPLVFLYNHIPEYADIPFIGFVNIACLMSATCALLLATITSDISQRKSLLPSTLEKIMTFLKCSSCMNNRETNSKRNNDEENRLLKINPTSDMKSNDLTNIRKIPPPKKSRNGDFHNETDAESPNIDGGHESSTLLDILYELRSFQRVTNTGNESEDKTVWCTFASFADQVLVIVFTVLFVVEILVLFCGFYTSY